MIFFKLLNGLTTSQSIPQLQPPITIGFIVVRFVKISPKQTKQTTNFLQDNRPKPTKIYQALMSIRMSCYLTIAKFEIAD